MLSYKWRHLEAYYNMAVLESEPELQLEYTALFQLLGHKRCEPGRVCQQPTVLWQQKKEDYSPSFDAFHAASIFS
uniref:Uncharacterized protein n=1 Tax=Panagrellus redivivus TaxID=6233 RepID=A0A7E4VEH0_PANRE